MIEYDSTAVKLGKYSLIPEGWFPFKIFSTEERTTRTGNDMVLCKCECLDPDYQDINIWHFVTFIPPGDPGDGINVNFRKSIGVEWEGKCSINVKDWIGKRFRGYVVQREYEGKMRNALTKIAPYEDKEKEDIPF